MLTSRRMYNAENAVALVYKHLNDPIPLLPANLARYQALLDRAVAKAPEDRFNSAASLIAHVEKTRKN